MGFGAAAEVAAIAGGLSSIAGVAGAQKVVGVGGLGAVGAVLPDGVETALSSSGADQPAGTPNHLLDTANLPDWSLGARRPGNHEA